MRYARSRRRDRLRAGPLGVVTLPLGADGVTLDLLRDWVEESYRIVAPKRLVAELDRATG